MKQRDRGKDIDLEREGKVKGIENYQINVFMATIGM